MAISTSRHAAPVNKSQSHFSSAWHIVADGIADIRTSWRRRRSAAMLEGLPLDLRKDIGWPTGDISDEAGTDTQH